MAAMEGCFQDWNGSTHHNVTTRWWVTGEKHKMFAQQLRLNQ
jgi:hypothetical protein